MYLPASARQRPRIESSRSPLDPSALTPARAGCLTAVLLLAVYAATVAPTVTLWDSGEFLAAARTLGVPHPPGTPLFIVIANVWARLAWFVPFALAVNVASAVATAVACGLLAAMVARATGMSFAAIAGGVSAGSMFAVWQNATETEVYALAMLLSVVTLWVASRREALGDRRSQHLVAFLFGLAVPLHLSALATAPAALWLLATDGDGHFSVRDALIPASAFLVAVGIGTMSLVPALAATALCGAAIARPAAHDSRASLAARAVAMLTLVALGSSFILVLLIRAGHDPAVNQGNAATLDALIDLVGRRQYDVPGLLPRRAPWWLQVGNMVQYADWQVAFALDSWPGASWRRTPWTLLVALLGWFGARRHVAVSRRVGVGLATALFCASLGVVGILNLKAGPSIGVGILPVGAVHEARERDYFFATAFAIWGFWAGVGVVELARRVRHWLPRAIVAMCCLVPLALNWRAADRSRPPQADLADVLGEVLLHSAEPNAVLVLAGDNDTYAVWYHQQVRGYRRDVVPVTLPLLPADWYRAELARRHALLPDDAALRWRGADAVLRQIAQRAREAGRPLNVSVSVPLDTRLVAASHWRLRGLVYARDSTAEPRSIDAGSTEAAHRLIVGRLRGPPPSDPTAAYVFALLRCAAAALESTPPVTGGAERQRFPRLPPVCNSPTAPGA